MSLASALVQAANLPPLETRPELLLMPNVPKPLHGVAPRVVLGKAWWDKTRQAAYRSTGHRCLACGVHKLMAQWHKWLEGHEVYEINYKRGTATYVETVPLCHFCHCFIHCGRLDAELQRGNIDQAKYSAVMAHGDLVLKSAGLSKKPPVLQVGPPWHRWRMIVNGEKHKPRFKDERDWMRHHGYLHDD